MRTSNTRILITGASSGIGAEVARQLSVAGNHLALVARRRSKLEAVAEECRSLGARITVVEADVGLAEDCERLVQEAVVALGGLDIVLLNAGISQHSDVDTWDSPAVADKIMQINYLGAVHCTWHALAHLKSSRGKIAVVSSLQGKAGFPGFAAYSASKHAIHGFFDALRGELIDAGVQVTIICPGPVATNIGSRPDNAPGVMPVEECARLTIKAIEQGRREEIMTFGGKIAVLMRPFIPKTIDRFIQKNLDQFYGS